MTTQNGTPAARTALQDTNALNGAVSVRELPLSGKIAVRGAADDAAFAATLAPGDNPLPTAVGERAEADGVRVVCLGPDEWQVHVPLDRVDAEVTRLRDGFGTAHSAVVDVSDYFTVLELGGVATREVLAKLTPLDVSAQALPAGSTRQTRMAKCTVLLTIQSDHCARLQVRWSHAEYLHDYLVEAAREFNL
ncbi:MAG: sarcosine oxidase subunit gamma family protein [Pseudomonadota bacterium]